MKKTKKVMELLLDDGRQFIVIRDYNGDAYKDHALYYRWYNNGWHKRKILVCGNVYEAMQYLVDHKYN